MEYTIVTGFEAEEIMTAVNKYLKEGWELHGSLSVSNFGDRTEGSVRHFYAQAMTKKATEQWSAA